jgi:hypothetical protein
VSNLKGRRTSQLTPIPAVVELADPGAAAHPAVFASDILVAGFLAQYRPGGG